MSHLLVRPLLHANVDPWMPDQVGHDDLERLPSLDCHSICEPCLMLLTGASTPAEIPIPTLVELFLVNGLLGLAAGRWYVKEGLVAAVGVHFWADIVWQVIGPLFYV